MAPGGRQATRSVEWAWQGKDSVRGTVARAHAPERAAPRDSGKVSPCGNGDQTLHVSPKELKTEFMLSLQDLNVGNQSESINTTKFLDAWFGARKAGSGLDTGDRQTNRWSSCSQGRKGLSKEEIISAQAASAGRWAHSLQHPGRGRPKVRE